MSKRYQYAVGAMIGTVTALTTASFSWWSAPAAAPESTLNSGALILNGTEIAKPFTFGIEENQVMVNGRIILELTPTTPAPREDYDQATVYGLISTALEQYAAIQNAQGRDEASAQTLALLRGNELVASARSLGTDSIEVYFRGDPYPEILELSGELRPPRGPEFDQQRLRERRQTIETFLRQNRLVVLQDGILVATEPGTAGDRIAVIREAAAPDLTLDHRRTLLQSVIPDSHVASLLAARLQADGGKAVQP
jgi:hypothetical protein